MDEKAYYVPVGNGTEVGLIKFLQDAEIPVHEIIKEKFGKIQTVIPFSTIRKKMVTAVKFEDEDKVRVFVKGAPEYIVNKCTRTLSIDGQKTSMHDD
jgi:magnesium-transporting ATPase (P-type)